MRPDDNQQPNVDSRGEITPPVRSHTLHYDAVASMTRQHIDEIYSKQAENEQTSTPEPAPEKNAYNRSHSMQHTIMPDKWQQYHSSWQNYYQQYYERYYVGEVNRAQQTYQQHAQQLQQNPQMSQTPLPDETNMSKDDAMHDLREELLTKVQASAIKVRKSRHFVPIISSVLVLLLFVVLQYNSIIFAYAQAYVSPGNIDPQNIIVDPNMSLSVSKEPRLVIPKINVDIHVDYNAKPDYNSQMAAMKKSVAYFGIAGADSLPGQYGNTPMAGHSSNDFTDTGAAKFIFARLDQLAKGDTFYLNYKGTRYTYTVTKKLVVNPTDTSALQIGDKKPYATLITCTPLGTATNRLLIIGEQISPSPSSASTAPSSGSVDQSTPEKMAGKSPTLLERAFGAH